MWTVQKGSYNINDPFPVLIKKVVGADQPHSVKDTSALPVHSTAVDLTKENTVLAVVLGDIAEVLTHPITTIGRAITTAKLGE